MSRFVVCAFSSTRLALLSLALLAVAGCGSSSQRAQNYYEHGMKLLKAHEYQKAAIEFKNAIKLKDSLLPAWRGLAQVQEAEHQWQPLTGSLQRIADLDPKDVETKLKLARLLLAGDATDRALKLINGLGGQETRSAKVLGLKAAISYKLKDATAAVNEAQDALKTDPNNIDATIVLVEERLAQGDAKGALQILDSHIGDRADDLAVLLLKIRIFAKSGDTAKLEAALRQLTERYPKMPVFRKRLAKFYLSQHREAAAENELRAAAKENAKDAEAELDLVRLLAATKGAAAARQELLARIAAGGDIFPYQLALADFDYAQGNFADSFRLVESLAGNKGSAEHALAAKLKLAYFNLGRKNLDAAEAIVADILSKDSRNTNALKIRALISMERGQLESAISDLRQALNDQPRATDLMLLLATAYERSGSVELAEKQFADATRASNYDPAVGLTFAAFLRRRGSIRRADDVLTDLSNRHPGDVKILSALAQIKIARQDWIGAAQLANSIRKIGNHDALADEVLGASLAGQHRYDQSIAALQSAAAAAPSAAQPMVSLVRELLQTKQTDKAVAFLQSALAKNPANAEALVLLGSIYLANGAPNKAVSSFKAAIDKQPKDPNGYHALAGLYLRQKDTDAALKVVRAGLQQVPDNAVLGTILAGILEQTGDYDAATAEYEHLLSQQPGNLIAANNLANLLVDHRNDQASLKRARAVAAILHNSQVPQFEDTLGWLDYRAGDFSAAIPLLEDAARKMPNLALVHYHLGMTYKATGQPTKAIKEFETALSKSPADQLAETVKAQLKGTATP